MKTLLTRRVRRVVPKTEFLKRIYPQPAFTISLWKWGILEKARDLKLLGSVSSGMTWGQTVDIFRTQEVIPAISPELSTVYPQENG